MSIESTQSLLTRAFLPVFHSQLGYPSVLKSICVVVLAPKLLSCNPPSMTQPTWCVSTVERLPGLALACGMKLLLASVLSGQKNATVTLKFIGHWMLNSTQGARQCLYRNPGLSYLVFMYLNLTVENNNLSSEMLLDQMLCEQKSFVVCLF